MKLKFLVTPFALILILFISNSTLVWAGKGKDSTQHPAAARGVQPQPASEPVAAPTKAEEVIPPAPTDFPNPEAWLKSPGWGGSKEKTGTAQNSNSGNGEEGSITGAQSRITNFYDWDSVNSAEHATLKNHGAQNNDGVKDIINANKNICSQLNADYGPDYEKCRRNVILYNEKTEEAKDEKGILPMLAKSKADYVGAMGQGGGSPKDTMELGSKFDAAMGLVMLTRGSRADGAQEANTKSAQENRIMAAQNAQQIRNIDDWNKTHPGDNREVKIANIHEAKFRKLADDGDIEAEKWDGKQSDARWAGLAMLGMGYFQHDLARKFDRDAERRITDPVGQVQPGLGLQPFAQNNQQPIPQTEYFGEQKQDPEANGYDKTGANSGSGEAASTGKLGLSQLSPSMPDHENKEDPNSALDPNMGLSRYSSNDDGGAAGNEDIKQYLDSVFGKNQGEGNAQSHKSTEFGSSEENLAKVKVLGKNEDIFKYISRIHKEQLGS